ncbi:MAG: alpha-rhamnosidase, partial [Dysgonamonadaceae bacterium]|nr:alpha-rhamnosidase [Dysgonamonadaceae bacterium]
MKRTTFLIAMLATLLLIGCQGKRPTAVALKVEMQENPQGIATQTPRFSWQITSDIPDVVQQSYRIQVAETEEDLEKEQNLLWDSGNVDSDQSILIP